MLEMLDRWLHFVDRAMVWAANSKLYRLWCVVILSIVSLFAPVARWQSVFFSRTLERSKVCYMEVLYGCVVGMCKWHYFLDRFFVVTCALLLLTCGGSLRRYLRRRLLWPTLTNTATSTCRAHPLWHVIHTISRASWSGCIFYIFINVIRFWSDVRRQVHGFSSKQQTANSK